MSTRRCRTTAPPSTCRAPPNTSTTCPSRPAPCMSRSAVRRSRAATIRGLDLAEVLSSRASSPSSPRRTYRAGTTFRRRMPMSRCSRTIASISTASRCSRWLRPRAIPRGARRCAAHFKIEAERPNVSVEQGKASGERVLARLRLRRRRCRQSDRGSRRFAVPARSTSAARSIFIWKARSRSPCPARTAPCWSIRRPSIRAKCSTSSPACSALPDSFVTCRVRRMGGGFGGKETQATQWAVIAALAARATGRPCKLRLDRDADMVDDRQAARFRGRLRRRLRSRRPHSGGGPRA